jgi:hypothetical protein
LAGRKAAGNRLKNMTLDDLITLQRQLIGADTVNARNEILEKIPAVQKLFHRSNGLSRFLQKATPEVQCALKQLAAIGQGLDVDEESVERWRNLASTSQEIDRFYREIGGLVGYQVSIENRTLLRRKGNVPLSSIS